jgi:hypothetical protein
MARSKKKASSTNANTNAIHVFNPWMPQQFERLTGNDEEVQQLVLGDGKMVERTLLELRIALSCYLRSAAQPKGGAMTEAESCVWLMALARNRRGNVLHSLPRDVFLFICDMVLRNDCHEPIGKQRVHFKLRLACETGKHASVAMSRVFEERNSLCKAMYTVLPFHIVYTCPELLEDSSASGRTGYRKRRELQRFRKIRQKARDEKERYVVQ